MKNSLFRNLLATILLALLLPTFSFAHDFEVGGIYYNIDGDNAVVTYKGNYITQYEEYIGNVNIPNKVSYRGKTYTVTSIGQFAFEDCTGLTSVTIPSSVTSVGYDAFHGCTGLKTVYYNAEDCQFDIGFSHPFSNCPIERIIIGENVKSIPYAFASRLTTLKEITIPSSVTSIGENAFYGCAGLTQVTIPSSVTSIESQAFSYCSGLTDINIQNSIIGPFMFYGCTGLTQITIPSSVTSVGDDAFSDCTGLTSVNIQNSTIGNYMFENCTGLTQVSIPSSVTSVGDAVFYGCTGLTSVNIQNSIIGGNMFENCTGLTQVTISSSVTVIGSQAFLDCTRLTKVTIPSSVTAIGSQAFLGCTGLKTVYYNAEDCQFYINFGHPFSNCPIERIIIGENVKSIPYAFASRLTTLKEITIPSSVTSIGENAFYGCAGLTQVTIPSSVTSIESQAFSYCSGLTDINIQNSIIGPFMFYGCAGLTQVTIPSSVTSVGDDAFSDCTGLTSVNIQNSTIGNYMFENCTGLTQVSIPSSVTSVGDGAFSDCTGLTDINIQNSTIGNYMFENCTGLTQVTIPSSVTSVGVAVFYGCTELTSVNIQNSIISGNMFKGCTGLTQVTIPSSVTAIGSQAFLGCTGLKTVYYNAEDCQFYIVYIPFDHPFSNCPIDKIVIGDNVKKIPRYFAYGLTGLTEITIPNSVTTIGDFAFYGCSVLESVICWALEPPRLGYNTFYGVLSSMCVNVPASAIVAYEGASGWNQFTILPMDEGHHTLSVSLPGNFNVQDYSNMRLEINNIENDEVHCITVTDKSSYKFTVELNSTWNVKLTNQYGDLFGNIEHVEVGEENVAVVFPSLLKPQNVSLKVKKPNGQDVTAQCKISWFDEDGELLLQGNPIKKLPAGRRLKYQVALPQDLATAFTLPSTNTYTIKDGNNDITCQLSAIGEAQLSGMVKDATKNQPLYGATISAVQSFGGGTTQTITATTDNQGLYSLDASTVPTTLTIAANGYINQTIDCDMSSGGGSTVTVPDVALSPITGAVVNINLTYTPAHAEGEATETQNWYSDYSNVDYEVYNMTTSHVITDINVQYPQIVLMEDVNDGDVLELTATSRKNAFKPVKTTVTIAEQKATAIFNIKELGKVTATFKKNINPKVTGTLYDAENKLVKTAEYTGSDLTMDALPDGDYKLVTMGKSDFFNSIYDLDQFIAAGLTEGDDYVKNEVQVESGLISNVTIDEVPFFDESKFYYTGEHTSFTVNKPDIVIGNYLTFRAQIDFKEQYANQVSDVQLIVDLPESCSFIDNSVTVGPALAVYSSSGNRITVPLQNWNDVVVRFCAIPTVRGGFAPSAFVRFKINGKYITQPIGNAPFTADGLSIIVPTMVANTEIPVSGTVIGVCNIDIYDNDVLIGQTISHANGSWSTTCELFDPYNYSIHRINAKVTTSQGRELQTEVADCLYDKYAILVSKVVMSHVNYEVFSTFEVVLDYLTPSLLTQDYWYYIYNKKFSFTIEFTDNDTNKVTNVVLYVKTAKSGWWPLEATYDSDKNCWFAQGEFGNMYDGDLPVNVSVDYDLLSWGPISRQSLSNAGFDYSGLSEEHDMIESEFLDFTNQFEAGIISTENFETKFDELTSMETSIVSDSTFDNLDLVSLLSLSDSLVQESTTYLNNALNVAFSELSEFGYFDLNEYGIDGSLEIKSTDGLSINQLLNRGFEKIEIDDDSEVYQLVTETSYEIADFKKGTFLILSYNYENSNLQSSFNEAGGIQSLIDKVNQFAQKHTVLLEWIGRINEGLSYIPSFFELKIDDLTRAIEENTAAYKALQYYEGMMPTLEENLEISDQISKLKAENIKLGKERTHLLKNFEAVKKAIEKVTIVISAFADAYSTGSNASEYINLWYSVPYCKCNPSKTEQLKNEIRNAGLRCAGKDLANIIGDIVSIHMIFGSVTAAPATGGSSLVLGVAGIGLSIIKGLVNNWAEKEFAKERALFSNRISALAKDKSCKECPPDPDPDSDPDPNPNNPNPVPNPGGHKYPGADMTFCMDPSGFVYEGVPSNRLQGVTATCYYKETVEDMYGDSVENVVLWDAENYGQENPLITDENGYYRWDVPIGMWQVKYEKEGYETTYSDWLPVPPPQLDVNIGMVQMRQPEVIKARAYPKAVEFEFDKFMFPETLNSDNISVIVNGSPVSGTIELLNAEVDDPLAITSIRRAPGTGLTFASKVRFNASSPFNADKVTLHVKKDVKSYADLEMYEDYETVLDVELEIQSIEADSTVNILYGDSRELIVTVLPANASRGKTLSVRSIAPMITTTDAETYTLNNNGQAIITVHGDLPGMASLLYSIVGYDLTTSTIVNVMSESQMTVATPTASIANGSVVPMGTAVYLRCATEGATIYYTLDGSCPCDNTPARKVYDGNPIIINSTTTIKAMAMAPDLYDSDVATFVYRVDNGLKGDVNGDGEVNIADINAVIDIILGGNADADTRARADVNKDGEINIADINVIIDIILNPSHLMSHKVNCNDKLRIDNVNIKPGEVRTLQVSVDHASRYSAMQCDIVLPDGLTLIGTNATGSNVSKIGNLDETSSRVLSYSPTKVPFASNGLGILTLTVRADETLKAESEIVLTNAVLADAENKAWHLADCKAQVNNTSGVNDLTAVADKVWVEGHTLFIEARHDGTAQLATINGIVCDIPVKVGVNQHRLDQGIYIVVINGISHKIAIKEN